MLQTGAEEILLGYETIFFKYIGVRKNFCKNCWGMKPKKHTQLQTVCHYAK